jgi:GT2 family glycosyltransferase
MIGLLEAEFPQVTVLLSEQNLGPGGARNRMLKAAQHEIVVSFDDDSFPQQDDFFLRLTAAFAALPEASILALPIDEPECPFPPVSDKPLEVSGFVGCGCAYRRSHFIEADGYVPIPIAYSMEEADLALRYIARGRRIFFFPGLRIYHNTMLSHHATAAVAAMQVANTALFVFLRYPLGCWPLGLAQVANKWLDTLRRRRWKGALLALPYIVSQCWRYRGYRAPVRANAVRKYRTLLKRNHGA